MKKIRILKGRFGDLYSQYLEKGFFEIHSGAFTVTEYHLPKNLDEKRFWEESAEIIAQEHEFLIDDIAYPDLEFEEDQKWLRRLKKSCNGKITIKYKIKDWTFML